MSKSANREKAKGLTIADVTQVAGVSNMTISRVSTIALSRLAYHHH
jgi:DNA-binding MurR/RpiR family transcriptional regulator